MERTVPQRGNEEIALYIRTYYSLLRSSREIKIRSLVEAHTRMGSALHVSAESEQIDLSALTYALLRLPTQIVCQIHTVVMGQSQQAFVEHGYPDVETWQEVGTPARRRRSYFDDKHTLAVYIASRSDIDDIIPILTAYQIERDKLFRMLGKPSIVAWLQEHQGDMLSADLISELQQLTPLTQADCQRFRQIWRESTLTNLLTIAIEKMSLTVRSLAGSLADYKRATRQWWEHGEASLPAIRFRDRPIYFISSNTHSIANLMSGFALTIKDELVAYVEASNSADLQQEYADILNSNVPSRLENFLYYVLKKYESDNPSVRQQRQAAEEAVGIYRVPSQHVFDSEIQVFDLAKVDADSLDPRLCFAGIERLCASEALIVNIDFPLGMAAYQLLSEISRHVSAFRGVYIMGKAATLNGRIGDVMIPSVVHDEHSLNTYLFENCISAETVAENLVYGSVLDNQKAITVPGTFLQNSEYMSVFYREGFTDMEMEAGPYLNCIYEMVRPKRYPTNEIVHLHPTPFPIGIVHYASDTPLSKGQNLGAQNLSYFGVDATYATSVAILDAILHEEICHLNA